MKAKIILIIIIIVLGLNTISCLQQYYKQDEKITTFNQGNVLYCDKLIVSNSNWYISHDKLINNSTAGYINLNKCTTKGN